MSIRKYYLHLITRAVTIGSNDQPISLILDTGSPITWVKPDCGQISDKYAKDREHCYTRPRYNPFTSTTAVVQNLHVNNTYGTGGVLGTYFADDITIGSVVAKDAACGVAAATFDIGAGILGIGARPEGYPPTVIKILALQDQISSQTYSIDLKSVNDTGTCCLSDVVVLY
jgi:hypothetical protein